jgi:hypothetical protein
VIVKLIIQKKNSYRNNKMFSLLAKALELFRHPVLLLAYKQEI